MFLYLTPKHKKDLKKSFPFWDRLEKREQEVVQAKDVKADIDDVRNKFLDNSKSRIERIVKDLRVAMEYSSAQLLKEVNKKVGDYI